MAKKDAGEEIRELVEVQRRLLAPGGCPWDREQTHESLVRYLLEETYEVIDTIYLGQPNKLREELGDLLLQVVFHAALAEEKGQFDLADVIHDIDAKMINRHPHVFGSLELDTAEQVLTEWEGFKAKEGKKSIMEGIPAHLPALLRAYKLQEKAARVGFDWDKIDGAWDKLAEETEELKAAVAEGNREHLEEEFGDYLFALVNISRFLNIMPEEALHKTNAKFLRRFNYIEQELATAGQQFADVDLEYMDSLWEKAKLRGL
ncbi:MAG: nucleoside triphosphate pyrophosphohydrolase [Methylocystaceae bacterium]